MKMIELHPYRFNDAFETSNSDSESTIRDRQPCSVPQTPFSIEVRYKRKPAILTVHGDHVTLEGEKFVAPVQISRDCPTLRFRYSCGDLPRRGKIIVLAEGKKYKLKVMGDKRLFLKLGWLQIWRACISDELLAKEKIVQVAKKQILFVPLIMTTAFVAAFWGVSIFFLTLIILQIRTDTRVYVITFFALMVAIASTIGAIGIFRGNDRLLLPMAILFPTYWIFLSLILLFVDAWLVSVTQSPFSEDGLRVILGGTFVIFMNVLYELYFLIPIINLKQLDRQLTECDE